MKLPDGPRTPSLLQTLQLVAQPTDFLDRCRDRYGDPFTTRVLGLNSPPVVFFGEPEAIQEIFALPAKKLDFQVATHVFQPLMGDRSVILQEGRAHQRTRQLLMPAFHGDRMKAYGQVICEITEEVTSSWKPGASVLIHQYMPDITLSIILRVVFGLEPGPRYEQVKALLSRLLDDVTTPIFSSQFFFPPLQKDLGAWSPWGNFLRRRQQIDELVYAEIEERRANSDRSSTDILSMLIAARDADGEQMTNQELRDQLVSLLLLGYETTAASLTWAFHWIHASASVQQRLQEELDSLGSDRTPEAIAQLPYLSAVCSETLRAYPIALICVPRMVKETLNIRGYDFEPGTILIPCIYLAHRRPQAYPNPTEFDPMHFLDRDLSPYEFLPFGGGSRGCIGTTFSRYEMKLILATILSRFQLSLSDNRPVRPVRRGITFVPSSGVPVVIHKCLSPES
jgi:cytochrome P450